jgi:murein DD-endopeptidase MepM/ murein hydrolase activator NlpD
MRYLVIYLFLLLNKCHAQESAEQTSNKQKQASTPHNIDPKDYPKNYFRDPLSIPIQLAANFGELRPNHFHMGWDIRTAQRENLPVYAAAEGYVSRISIEVSGFGNAIYINHPNGFTTVYGHLNEFFPALAAYIKNKQYAEESWAQSITFTPDQFPVTKGQFIALSGNTGASAGPHVHFEIRNTETEDNLNPWLFHIAMPDNIPPSIFRLYYYDRNYSTYAGGPKAMPVSGSNGNYISPGLHILPSKVSFGIAADDAFNGTPPKYGIYNAELRVDDSLASSFTINNISYNNTRYLNASIDYKTKASGGSYIQHISRLPGNQSSIFAKTSNDGVIAFTDSAVHNAVITVRDAAGNASTLSFKFKATAVTGNHATPANSIDLLPNQENLINKDDIQVKFSANAFYDTVPFVYKAEASNDRKVVSRLHYLHSYTVPVHDFYTIKVQPTVTLTDEQRDKVVMELLVNKKVVAIKGTWDNNWLSGQFRELGIVKLVIDSTPPRIALNGWKNGANLRNAKTMSFYAKDNSDLKSVNAYLDGKWLLFSQKAGAYIHKFDERTSPGSHTLRIVAEDIAGNITERNFTFTK